MIKFSAAAAAAIADNWLGANADPWWLWWLYGWYGWYMGLCKCARPLNGESDKVWWYPNGFNMSDLDAGVGVDDGDDDITWDDWAKCDCSKASMKI